MHCAYTGGTALILISIHICWTGSYGEVNHVQTGYFLMRMRTRMLRQQFLIREHLPHLQLPCFDFTTQRLAVPCVREMNTTALRFLYRVIRTSPGAGNGVAGGQGSLHWRMSYCTLVRRLSTPNMAMIRCLTPYARTCVLWPQGIYCGGAWFALPFSSAE